MKLFGWMTAMVAAASLLAGGQAARAANWHNPYGNVDHSNDAGNDTGDARVDQLNASQLDQNYRGPFYARQPAMPPGQGYAGGQGYPPPPAGYAPPPPGYAGPPGYAPPPPGYPAARGY